jgi:hypothetical protein
MSRHRPHLLLHRHRSMGIHRAEEARQSIRKRRLSRNRESLELQGITAPPENQNMEDLGESGDWIFSLKIGKKRHRLWRLLCRGFSL